MERNKHKVSGGRLDLNLWALSRVTFTFSVQAFEILSRMKRGGVNHYPETIDINPKPPPKRGACVHSHKGLRKGVMTFSIEMTSEKITGIYSDPSWSVLRQG